MQIRSAYDRGDSSGIVFSDKEKRTKNSFVKECDINVIMNKYRRTGVLPEGSTRRPLYGDFSTGLEYQNLQNMLIDAQVSFEALPSFVRDMFDNDVSLAIDFIADPANADEAVKLGLLDAASKPSSDAGQAAAGTPAVSGDEKLSEGDVEPSEGV